MPPEGFREFRDGAIAVLPAVVAVVPFGLLLGALAAQKDLSPLEVALMSGLVFAGASQFVAVEIWASPAPWLLLTLTALMVNSRHLLMGAAWAPKIAGFTRGQSFVALFFLADEVWAMSEGRARTRPLGFSYILGVGLPLWGAWLTTTVIGAAAGMVVEDPAVWGFDFAFTAIFVALLVGLWRGPRTGIAIAASAVTAVAVHLAVDGPWYIAAGGIAGALAGAAAAPTEEAA